MSLWMNINACLCTYNNKCMVCLCNSMCSLKVYVTRNKSTESILFKSLHEPLALALYFLILSFYFNPSPLICASPWVCGLPAIFQHICLQKWLHSFSFSTFLLLAFSLVFPAYQQAKTVSLLTNGIHRIQRGIPHQERMLSNGNTCPLLVGV